APNSGTGVSDAVSPFVRWDNFTSPYGPLFTLFSYALVPLGLPLNLWALKFSVLVASLGCFALIYACARERCRGARPPHGGVVDVPAVGGRPAAPARAGAGGRRQRVPGRGHQGLGRARR